MRTLLVVLCLPLLLGALLLSLLVISTLTRLLSTLTLLVILCLPLLLRVLLLSLLVISGLTRLLSTLPLLAVLRLPLLLGVLLLSMLGLRPGLLALLLLLSWTVLLFALAVVLPIKGRRDSQKQSQNTGAGDSNDSH